MTLLELTDAIEQLALTSPIVHYAASGANVYTLNDRTVKDYAAIYIMPDGTHTVMTDTTRYHLTIFYIDRLTSDHSNSAQIFSSGIQVLTNLVRGIADIDGVADVNADLTVQNFIEPSREKMSDMCAGAYISATVTVPNGATCFDGVVPHNIAPYEKAMQSAGYLHELDNDVAAIEASGEMTTLLGNSFDEATFSRCFPWMYTATAAYRGTVIHFPKGYLDNVVVDTFNRLQFNCFCRCRDDINIAITGRSQVKWSGLQAFNKSAFENITITVTPDAMASLNNGDASQFFYGTLGTGTITLKGDSSGLKIINQMFNECSHTRILGLDLSSVESAGNAFNGNIRYIELVGYINTDIVLANLAGYGYYGGRYGGIERPTIMNFIEAYGRRPDKSVTRTLTLGELLLAKLTDEDKALAASYNLTLN